MAIHGVDVSRYQDLEDINGWSFAIINVEDPGLATKIAYCRALGIPWGLYTWIYPGRGRSDMNRALVKGVQFGEPPLGYWLDYEQAGVTPADLDAALDTAAEQGALARTGVYTYLHMIAGVAEHLRDRPLWIAYYPGANDGTYPSGQGGNAQAWGAVLWQYSSGGNLDRNVVIDEAWYRSFVSGGEDDDMDAADKLRLEVAQQDARWTRAYLEGVPGVFPDLATRIKDGIEHPDPVNLDAKEVAANIAAALGDDLAQQVADELAARLAQK